MSVAEALQQQIDGLRKTLVGLANVPDALEEHVFGALQGLAVGLTHRALEALGERDGLRQVQVLMETFVRVAERDGRELPTNWLS